MIVNSLKKHFRENRIYYILLIALPAAMTALISPFCRADYINYDSAYQFFLTRHNMQEIWRLLAEDYSPPLYTLILKASSSVFGGTLYVMRMTSAIFIAGMIFLALFPLRKAFGTKTAAVCAGMFMLSGINLMLVQEIRPTIAAYFFVSAAAVYAYLSFFSEERYPVVCMTVFSVLSMYVHNVGMLSALAFYITALLFSLCTKNYAKLKRFFISGCICAAAYLPWLTVVLKQFENVRNGYWKNLSHSFSDILDWTIKPVFIDFSSSALYPVILALIGISAVVFITKRIDFKNLKNAKHFRDIEILDIKKHRDEYLKVLYLICLFAAPVIVLELFCLLVYPLIASRYFYIFSGIAVILMAVLISKCSGKIMLSLISAAIVINAGTAVYNRYEAVSEADFGEMTELIAEQSAQGQPAFVHSHEWTLGMMMYYFPQARHYVADDTWCVLNSYDVFPSEVVNIGGFENISAYEERFYAFAGTFPDAEYDLCGYYAELDGYSVKNLGVYREPYSYRQSWDLCEIYSKKAYEDEN